MDDIRQQGDKEINYITVDDNSKYNIDIIESDNDNSSIVECKQEEANSFEMIEEDEETIIDNDMIGQYDTIDEAELPYKKEKQA